MEVDLLGEGDFDEVRAFLQQVYGHDEPRKLTDDFWRWKCTRPHPFRHESRGFIRRGKEGIVAYASLMPIRFLTASGPVSGGHVIDWAAVRNVPGAGIRLYRHIRSLAGCIIGIGGSQDTRQILPRIGAVPRQTVASYLRPVRPFHTASVGKKWKWPARLARDLRYALAPLPSVSAGFEATRVQRFDSSLDPVLPTACQGVILPERTVDLLNYWLDCPAASLSGYVLRKDRDVIGYFLVSVVNTAARIADLWVRPQDEAYWTSAYSLAFRAAASTGAWTVEAMTGHPLARRVLDRATLRRGENQVFLLDPDQTLPPDLPLALNSMDYDGFYI